MTSNQGFVLDFTLKVLLGETESTADDNLVTTAWQTWFMVSVGKNY